MRLLTLCFPTYGRDNEIQYNARGDRVVLAPDEFHRNFLEAGWHVDVVTLTKKVPEPLFRSLLPLKLPSEVDLESYDVVWHMFRDPTQPEVIAALGQLDLRDQERAINNAFKLRWHEKGHYLPPLGKYGLAPRLANIDPTLVEWQHREDSEINSELVSRDLRYIESYAYNNNRGDYPGRRERIITEYIDNASNEFRSMVRVGYAFGRGFEGMEYFHPASVLSFKTAGAVRCEPYEVPRRYWEPITRAMEELGCDVCHIEAIPRRDEFYIIDVNPYPTAHGTTLSPITERVATILMDVLGDRR